jgi:uncharacterized protein HemY
MMSSLRIHRLVENLFEGDEDFFTGGLLQELDIRKQELCKNLSVEIFENMATLPVLKEIKENTDIKKLIMILNEIDAKKSAKIEFKNASIINISENEIKPIKLLFDNLNESNQKHLAKNLFDSPKNFKQTLEFAKKLQGLIT